MSSRREAASVARFGSAALPGVAAGVSFGYQVEARLGDAATLDSCLENLQIHTVTCGSRSVVTEDAGSTLGGRTRPDCC